MKSAPGVAFANTMPPHSATDAVDEAELGEVDVGELLLLRHAAQRAVEREVPEVVRAHDPGARVAGVFEQSVPTVRAEVVERAELTVEVRA